MRAQLGEWLVELLIVLPADEKGGLRLSHRVVEALSGSRPSSAYTEMNGERMMVPVRTSKAGDTGLSVTNSACRETAYVRSQLSRPTSKRLNRRDEIASAPFPNRLTLLTGAIRP
jgi:hypothetical protein